MKPDIIEVANALCMRIRLQKLADKQCLDAAVERGRQARIKRLAETPPPPSDWDAFEARNRALPADQQVD